MKITRVYINNGEYAILERESDFEPFIVAWLFDEETQTWEHGTYFKNINDAINCYMCKTDIRTMKSKCLLENLISYLKETDQINDFCEDRDYIFDQEELDYFDFDDEEQHDYKETFWNEY